MAKSIYVGNLPWSATEEQVQSLFADYGPVVSVKLVSDRETGRARGFGFVEMEEPGASAAIEALDNANFGGRTLRVNEAKPRAPRPPRSDRRHLERYRVHPQKIGAYFFPLMPPYAANLAARQTHSPFASRLQTM